MEATTQKIDLNNIDKSNWETFRFEEIASKISETVDPNSTDLKTYVGLEHLDAKDIHIRKKGTPDDVSGGKLKCYPGDLIFGKRRAYQRKAAIVDFEGICSAHAFVFRANPEVIDPKLFPFFLHSDQFMHRMVDISVGGLSPTINWGDLKHQEFLLPPKDQQAQLAELLWAMDEVIEREREVLANLYRTYISMIENTLINRDSSKVYFGNLVNVVRGVGFKPDQLLDANSDDSVVLLRSNNISEGKLNYDDVKIIPESLVKQDQVLQEGDFPICMSNGSKELVGKCAEYSLGQEKVTIGSFCAALRPLNDGKRQLIRHLVNSESYRLAIKRILTGSAINNLKPSDIEDLFLKVNTESIESGILNKLDSIRKNWIGLESTISSSQTLQKSLINQVFG